MSRSCGALLRKGCCLACKGLTSVGLADSLRVTHCLGEGKSNRKGSLKKVPVQRGPKVRFLWPSPHIFCTCFSNLLNYTSMVFGFADCCTVPFLNTSGGSFVFYSYCGVNFKSTFLAWVPLSCPWPHSSFATLVSLLPISSPWYTVPLSRSEVSADKTASHLTQRLHVFVCVCVFE